MRSESTVGLDARRLARLVPLGVLHPAGIEELIANAELLVLETGVRLMGAQLEADRSVYLIEGRVEVFNQDEKTLSICAEDECANHPLPGLGVQAGVVVANTTARLLSIDNDKLSAMLVASNMTECSHLLDGDDSTNVHRLIARVMSLDLFAHLPPANVQRIFRLLNRRLVRRGERVLEQNARGEHYYIIDSGRFEMSREPLGSGEETALTELGAGDSFGEEALVPNVTYQASVRASSDGVLFALAQKDLADLMQIPATDTVSCTRAEDLIRTGALWLDVRTREEHRHRGISGSINVPLHELQRHAGWGRDRVYVAYCDNGYRSAAAAFELAELGFSACVLSGGLRGSTPERPPRVVPRALAPPAPVHTEQEPIEGTHESSATRDEQAPATQRQVGNEGAAKVEADSDGSLAQLIEAHEQARVRAAALEQESRRASRELDEARKRTKALEAHLEGAQTQAASERVEAERRRAQLKDQAEAALQAEEEKLRSEYEQAALALQNERESTEARLREERRKLDEQIKALAERAASEQRRLEEQMRAAKSRLELRAKETRSRNDERARLTREELEQALRTKRERMEAELASSVATKARAEKALAVAENAHRAAAQAAGAIAQEIEAARRSQREAQKQALVAERARLASAAARAKARLEEALREQQQAEEAERSIAERLAALGGGGEKPSVSPHVRASSAVELPVLTERVQTEPTDSGATERQSGAAQGAAAPSDGNERDALESRLRVELEEQLEAETRAREQTAEVVGWTPTNTRDKAVADVVMADVEAQLGRSAAPVTPALELLSPSVRIEATLKKRNAREALGRAWRQIERAGGVKRDKGS